MSTYTTQSGDMFDLIAFRVYGSTDHTAKLVKANTAYSQVFIFSAGIVLNVPDLDQSDYDTSYIPPWRR